MLTCRRASLLCLSCSSLVPVLDFNQCLSTQKCNPLNLLKALNYTFPWFRSLTEARPALRLCCLCDLSLFARRKWCSVGCIVQNVLSEVSSIIVTRPNEDVRLITRLTGRYSLWNEAQLWADILQSAVREIVTPHSFAPLTGFGTHEKL